MVLIPSQIDGEPFTLTKLGELAKRYFPNQESGYRHYASDVQSQFGNQAPVESYWLLLTRNVLHDSQGKNYHAQKNMVPENYNLPSALEAATGILTYYARHNKKRLFSDRPWTYTRCTEMQLVNDRLPIVVVGFVSEGPHINYEDSVCDDDGIACCRKLE